MGKNTFRMSTYTGGIFDFKDIEDNIINIGDISHALSKTCRFNGHIPKFYSVCTHSLIGSTFADDNKLGNLVEMGFLLHDASEAYLNDIVRPAKGLVSGYYDIEKRVQDHILNELLIGPLNIDTLSNEYEESLKIIKEIDLIICEAEGNVFIPVKPFKWDYHTENLEWLKILEHDINLNKDNSWNFDIVADRFTELYIEIKGRF